MIFYTGIFKDCSHFWEPLMSFLSFQKKLFFKPPLGGFFLVCCCLLSCYLNCCLSLILKITLHYNSVWVILLIFNFFLPYTDKIGILLPTKRTSSKWIIKMPHATLLIFSKLVLKTWETRYWFSAWLVIGNFERILCI